MTDGDHRARLLTLRDRLADAIDEAGPRDLAALAKQYADVIREIAAMPEAKELTPLDDLETRRAARIAAAQAV